MQEAQNEKIPGKRQWLPTFHILAWKTPWIEPGGQQSMGSQKIQTQLSD